VETLLSLEKLTRTAADMHSTAKLLVAIVKICYEAKDFTALNENIVLLTKRRGQLKQVSWCPFNFEFMSGKYRLMPHCSKCMYAYAGFSLVLAEISYL